jgi:hypothetical protein
MSVDFSITIESLKVGIGSALKDLVAGAGEDLRASLQGEVQRITERASVLGLQALQGDELARETLRDLQAQAISEAAIVAIREEDRVLRTAQLIVSMLLKALIGIAVAAA